MPALSVRPGRRAAGLSFLLALSILAGCAQPYEGPLEGGGGLGPPLAHVFFGKFFAEGPLVVDH